MGFGAKPRTTWLNGKAGRAILGWASRCSVSMGRPASQPRTCWPEVDILVFDVPDVGTRVYTFIWTMALAMQAARAQGIPFVVLDRPNPIGGLDIEGAVLEREWASFVGMYPLPMRHAMTVGELARMFNATEGIGCELYVVPMEGWSRPQWFDTTWLPWVMPSPNMPTLDTATVYPGMVLLEGTTLSEGRGTTRPFEIFGAPFIDPYELAAALSRSSCRASTSDHFGFSRHSTSLPDSCVVGCNCMSRTDIHFAPTARQLRFSKLSGACTRKNHCGASHPTNMSSTGFLSMSLPDRLAYGLLLKRMQTGKRLLLLTNQPWKSSAAGAPLTCSITSNLARGDHSTRKRPRAITCPRASRRAGVTTTT